MYIFAKKTPNFITLREGSKSQRCTLGDIQLWFWGGADSEFPV